MDNLFEMLLQTRNLINLLLLHPNDRRPMLLHHSGHLGLVPGDLNAQLLELGHLNLDSFRGLIIPISEDTVLDSERPVLLLDNVESLGKEPQLVLQTGLLEFDLLDGYALLHVVLKSVLLNDPFNLVLQRGNLHF